MMNKQTWKELAVILVACAVIAATDHFLIVHYGHSISEIFFRKERD